MAAPPNPPEAPASDLDIEFEVQGDGVRVRFRVNTKMMVILGLTGVTLVTIYGKENIKPTVESLCKAVFGACRLTKGSIVVDVDCFAVTRVEELLDSYQCGKLKRKFLEELRKIGGKAEDLKIKFEVEETLKLNHDRKQRYVSFHLNVVKIMDLSMYRDNGHTK